MAKTPTLKDLLSKSTKDSDPEVESVITNNGAAVFQPNFSVHQWEGDKTPDVPTVPEGITPDTHLLPDQVGKRVDS